MKVQLWFYKAEGRLFDHLIRWYTGSPYSHVAICCDGLMYSADAWNNRVNVKSVNSYMRGNWDIVDVDTPHDSAWLNGQLGKKYDWLGIFGFLAGGIQLNNRWYCSELAAAYLNLPLRPVSPGKLYCLISYIRSGV